MSEEENNNTKVSTFFTLTVIVIVAIVFSMVISLLVVTLNSEEVDHLKTEIENKDVSDDYRQGWLDCIDELVDFRNKAVNMSAV